MAAAATGGCWSEEPLVNGAFTTEQWLHLQKKFAPPPAPDPDSCARSGYDYSPNLCRPAAQLGQQLFFEPALSGPGTTSCATCHDPVSSDENAGWFVDLRPGSALSMGAKSMTGHNTITLVNVAVGDRDTFGWTGECTGRPCTTPIVLLEDIALPNAMSSAPDIIGAAMRTPAYAARYQQVFGSFGTNTEIQRNVELALEAYMRRLVSLDAPFDAFILGDADAIDDSAKRGFALFVGRAMCAECHRGSLFSDDQFRVTGVTDDSDDKGRAGTGGYYTAGLRNVAMTSPYMHNGSVNTLAEVIDFYAWGGGTSRYHGTKDALLEPVDLDEQDRKDLEAFLCSLTGRPVAHALRQDTRDLKAVLPSSCAAGTCEP